LATYLAATLAAAKFIFAFNIFFAALLLISAVVGAIREFNPFIVFGGFMLTDIWLVGAYWFYVVSRACIEVRAGRN
jgi:hypothetical protein